MNRINSFLCVSLLLFFTATEAQIISEKEDCPRLSALMQDRAFIEKVARENDLSPIRFLSQETRTIKTMSVAYAKKRGLC